MYGPPPNSSLFPHPALLPFFWPHLFHGFPADAYSSRIVPRRFDPPPRLRRVPAAARPYPAEPDRPGNAAVPIRGQGAAGGEYRESMRVHTPVRRTGGAVPPLPREGPCCTGLSRQRFRRPRTRRQPRHPQTLREDLRCELFDVREIRRCRGCLLVPRFDKVQAELQSHTNLVFRL